MVAQSGEVAVGRGSIATSASYLWRVFATCFAFLCFNVGGLLIAVPTIAICRVIPGSPERKNRRVQHAVHVLLRAFIAGLVGLGLLTHSRKEFERLHDARASLVIANHPTLLDVVFLIASMPNVDCVVKEAVWNNVFMRFTARSAGYIPNSEGAGLIDACVERLAKGHHVLLFPEGTRSPAEALHHFRRGAARIALRSGCEILPIVITCKPPTLLKGMPIFHAPPSRPHFSLEVQEPISPSSFVDASEEITIAVRRLTAGLENYYETRLGCRCV